MKTPTLRVTRKRYQDGRWRFKIWAGKRQIAYSGQSYPDTDAGLYQMAKDIALLVPSEIAIKPVKR
jgi:hypothetical protein